MVKMAGYSYMDVTIARPSSECLLSSTQPLGTADASILLSSTQPIPKARCLVPLVRIKQPCHSFRVYQRLPERGTQTNTVRDVTRARD